MKVLNNGIRSKARPYQARVARISEVFKALIKDDGGPSVAGVPSEIRNGVGALIELAEAAIAYRESQRVYDEGSLKERVPNGTKINKCRAALDATITMVKGKST